jgi:hypothetical protein
VVGEEVKRSEDFGVEMDMDMEMEMEMGRGEERREERLCGWGGVG